MAFEVITRPPLSFNAASQVAPNRPVMLSASQTRTVLPCASTNHRPIGLTGDVGSATVAASQGFQVGVHTSGNIVKAVAGASLGAGAEVGIASAAGALVPISGASGSEVWAVGQSLQAAAAGSKFSIIVNPRQLSKLA